MLAESADTSRCAATTISRRSGAHRMAGKAPRTPKDLECPHGVQFYDVVIDGERHPRNAWIYERPQPA